MIFRYEVANAQMNSAVMFLSGVFYRDICVRPDTGTSLLSIKTWLTHLCLYSGYVELMKTCSIKLPVS